MRIVFCDNLIDGKVDPDFKGEYNAAIRNGLHVELISYENLNAGNGIKAISRVREVQPVQPAMYRGWMLSPTTYKLLYDALLQKGLRLINTPDEYRHCHYLPESYEYIESITPTTKWLEIPTDVDFDKVYQTIEDFGDAPIIVKDYVKSQKHNWQEACFIPQASDKASVKKVVSKFLELQGPQLAVGLVFRKFEELVFLTNHSKSNMPLTKEFRLFFLYGRLIQMLKYWDEGDYAGANPDIERFIPIATTIKSNFFTMDIAQKRDGEWIIMELGDGQVSGLPENANKEEFYKCLL